MRRCFRQLDRSSNSNIGQSRQGIRRDFGPSRANIILQTQKETQGMGRVTDGVMCQLIEIDLQFGSTLDCKLGTLLRRSFFNGTSRVLVGAVKEKE